MTSARSRSGHSGAGGGCAQEDGAGEGPKGTWEVATRELTGEAGLSGLCAGHTWALVHSKEPSAYPCPRLLGPRGTWGLKAR